MIVYTHKEIQGTMSDKISTTSLSSRGQVVIPLDIREKLSLEEGEKFIVVGEKDTIILKKIQMPSLKDIGNMLKKR